MSGPAEPEEIEAPELDFGENESATDCECSVVNLVVAVVCGVLAFLYFK